MGSSDRIHRAQTICAKLEAEYIRASRRVDPNARVDARHPESPVAPLAEPQ